MLKARLIFLLLWKPSWTRPFLFFFTMDGHSELYCFDKKQKRSGALIIYEKIMWNKFLMNHNLPHIIMGIFMQLNLWKFKWKRLIITLKKVLICSANFYKCIAANWGFNAEESEPCLLQFLCEMKAVNLFKEPACDKSFSKWPKSTSCAIDLVITNSSSNIWNTKTVSSQLCAQNCYDC